MFRKPLILMLAFALLFVALSAIVPAVRSAGEVAAEVIDSAPVRGEELTLDGTVTLYFNQPMDRASVEAAFSVTPAVQGTFSWSDDATVTFKPSASLQRATEYTFHLGATAKSADGSPLKDTYSLRLQTIGFLEVAQIIPADDADNVEADSTITVIFNRPVVPLLPVEEMSTLPSPIRIDPPTTGTGQWVNTSIYTFKPDAPLQGGTTYVVTVPQGLTDVTGSVLQNDVRSTFRTISPSIIEFAPANDAEGVPLDSKISVTFSQPMDRASTEAAFSLHVIGKAGNTTGSFEWSDDNLRLTFTPDARLEYASNYVVEVDTRTARSATGGTLIGSVTNDFRTMLLPEIIGTYPQNNDQDVRASGFSITFSAPMNFENFGDRITIDPKPGLKFDDSSYDTYNGSYVYNVGFSQEPSTSYTITLDTNGLVDKYGTPLRINPNSRIYRVLGDGKLQFSFTTPMFPPEASLKTGGPIGLYSAYTATTRVYSTHRNINRIDLSLWKMPISELVSVLADGAYGVPYNYAPPQSNFLRSWSVALENPTNILRYDLLAITDEGTSGSAAPAAFECPGAPPTQLAVGMEVYVLYDDPRPIRVRENAGLAGRQITQANPGTVFSVVGGPVCSDGYVWWSVVSEDETIRGWVAEGNLENYFIGPNYPANSGVPSGDGPTIVENTASAPLKPGAYLLYYTAPELADAYYGDIRHLMIVATANLTLKVNDNSALAWVTDLQSGQPVAGAVVTFYQKGTAIGQATSDANGIATLKLPVRLETLYTEISAIVDDGTTYAVAALSWDQGISSWEFNQPDDYYSQRMTVYMYSDRSLYRPGQPVYFRGVLRDKADKTYTLSALKTISVEVRNDQDEVIYSKDLELTPYGSFSDSFTVAEDAPLGYYRIIARPGGDDPNAPTFVRGINVAQYRVPEFQVKLTPAATAVVQGDKITLTVESSFFFGGAVSNARVEWSAFSQPYFFNYRGQGNYNFTNINEDEGYRAFETSYGDTVGEGKGTTDAQGRFTIELPADLGKAGSSRTYTIEARVTDESDQMIAGRQEITVHQGEFYIGAAPDEYVGTAGKDAKINLITVDWNSQAVPNTPLSVKVVERNWHSTQSVDPATGRSVWNWEVEETPVTDGVATTDADGKAVYSFVPPKGGVYKILATGRDSRGNQITTSTFLWVAGPDYVPWRQQNSNRIDLKIDKTNFQVGDTASILIASPFQGATKALITVERGHILKTEVIDMPNNSYVYKLPITADMAPNAFVSVTVVKGVDETNPVPAFRMGLIGFGVEIDQLKLNITLTPDKEQAGPRDTVTYAIKVTDYAGNPVQAEVGVGLTDLAVLSLLPDTSTPILEHFYSQAGIGVRTANSLILSVDQQTQEILNTIKGGGGGGPEGGIFEVRQLFIDTPLWQPSVITDANGEASVSVTLPDQLTTWRLDARAITQPTGELGTTLVGQTTVDLISTKPLLIRPVTPRFYVVGDQSTLVAIVNNNTDSDQQVNVHIEVVGATLKDDAAKSATIPSKGRMRFEWGIEVQDVSALDVTFFAATADNKYTDAAKSAVGQGDDKTLPVIKYEAPETVSTGGVITAEGGARTEGIILPRRFDITQGTLDIRLDRSLAAATTSALKVLEYYPYYCTEQTISRFLPNVATYGALTKLGVNDPAMKADLDAILNISVQRLYADQKVDGGWGWFPTEPSNPLVTAYALIGLAEAQKQGFQIDQTVIEAAIRNLREETAKRLPNQPSRWQVNRQAFLIYALAYAGAGNFSQAVNLYNVRDNLSTYARAYLAMAFKLMDPANTRYTDALVSDFANRVILSATGAHWEEDYRDYWNWNTDTRTTALVLKALIQIQPSNQLIPNVVRWIMVARTADAWETTQETAWAVLALTDWMVVTNELNPSYTFGATLNGKSLTTTETASPQNVRDSVQLQVQVQDLLKGELNRFTVDRTAGDGQLYYTAHLTAYLPVEQVQPLSRGITISRQYSLASDPNNTPITEAHVGDNIRVTLTIVAPNDLNYAVITDPIPAGTEGVDPGLATTAIGQEPQLRDTDPLYDGWGWWWFSKTEFRDDRVVLYATYLPRGTYQYTYTLRAGLPGVYRVIPATGQEFYFPDTYGRSAGSLFTLLPATDAASDPTNPVTPTPSN
ncbi:MAG: Ig-like domain-containing protein [Anaerolineae bacterium]|nr:Ig-like domain-containing protein [Anaerolineae bacterium]